MRDQNDLAEGIWAVFAFFLGEAFAAMTIAPMLYGTPHFMRIAFSAGFGLFLAASFFLIGLPFVSAVKSLFIYLKGKFDVCRTKYTKKS